MQRSFFKFGVRVSVAALALSGLVLSAMTAAHAQANLTFSGGSGTPLTLTLAAPVSYTITANGAATTAPVFIFDAVGGPSIGGPATSTITFNVNGGTSRTLNRITNGIAGGAVTVDDLYVFGTGSLPGVSIGDIVTLTSGTLTTTGNIAGALPANGSFTTFITDGGGVLLSGNGTPAAAAAPEPGSLALFGTMGVPTGLVAVRKLRRLKK